MPRRLPPFVQRHRSKFRGWAFVAGSRIYGPTRDDPITAHHDALRMRQRAESLPSRTITVRQAVDRLLEEVEQTRTAGTRAWYKAQFDAILKVVRGDAPLAKVTVEALKHLIRKRAREVSPNTLAHHRRALHRLFVWAKRTGYVDENPVPDAPWPPTERRKPDVMTAAEVREALTRIYAMAPADGDLVVVTIYTGLRLSELARVRVEDIERDGSALWVHGKRRSEAVHVDPDARGALMAMMGRADGEWLLPGATERERGYAVANTFRRCRSRLRDRRFHAHTMRHSLATQLIREGVDPVRVQRMLRHRSYATTQRYVHLVNRDLEDATRRLRLLPPVGQVDGGSHG